MVEEHLHQPKWESIREMIANLVLGFAARALIILVVCPLLGIPADFMGALALSSILTVWSFIQHYFVRRHYSRKHANRILDHVDEHIEDSVKRKVRRAVNRAVKKALEGQTDGN